MSVTRPMAWADPRSMSFVTVDGFMSTQMVLTNDGKRLPTAIECSIVPSIMVMPTPCRALSIASLARTVSVMTSGRGPSSRIDPARMYVMPFSVASYIMPPLSFPCSIAFLMEPLAMISLMA